MEDRVGYTPTSFGVYGLEHGRRRDLSITISGGDKLSPDWQFSCFPTGGGSLPVVGRLIVDLTDFVSQYHSSCFYLTASDTALDMAEYQPPVTGSVTEFWIEQSGSPTTLVSGDAPQKTIDYDPTKGGAPLFVRLYAGMIGNQPLLPGKVEFDQGAHAWCDYNNDGLPDLAVCGTNGATDSAAGYVTTIYHNDGNGVFTDIAAGLQGVMGTLAWGDYDNDGRPDLIVSGRPIWSSPPVTKLYHNEGGDLFVDSKIALPGDATSAAWVDYDNDGRLDLALFSGGVRLYHNDGGGKFTDQGLATTAQSGAMAWADYDNDGWMDVAVTGSLPQFSQNLESCRIYRNNHNGTFSESVALQGGSDGALAWGDYDNDGWLDLAVLAPSYDGQSHSHIYRNTRTGSFVDSGAALPNLYDGALAWGDYDNDGRLDLAIFGDLLSTSVVHKKKTTRVYRQFADGTFRAIGADLPPMSLGSVSWCDVDGDGDLDLCLSGYGEMQLAPNAYPLPRYTRIYRGFASQAPLGLGGVNTPPSIPSGLTATTAGAPGGGVKLTWSGSSDAQTTQSAGLYYNVRAGTMPGWNNVLSGVNPSPAMGGRLRPTLAANSPGVILKSIPASGIYWSVQAIDTGLGASAWSVSKFFSPAGKLMGDVNGDGRVDVADLICCQKMICGQIAPDLTKADLNGDGKVGELDALAVRSLLLGTSAPDPGIIDLKTIGPAGGTLDATGIQISVPAGAFTTGQALDLRYSAGDRPYGDRSVSGTILLEGLPQNFTAPITIRIKPDAAVKNKTFGTIGETVFVPSLGGMRRSFQLLPATAQSDGSYSFQLPAQAAGLSRLAANDGGADPIADYRFDYYCGLISDYAEMTGAHFKIRFPSTTAVNDMTNLATYLEEAYNKFKPGSAFNFSYAARSSWPMCVEAKPLDAGVYGYYTSSKLGNNFGSMEFNTALLSDAAEMRVTVGHEFFHFVQSLYDPRNRFSKAVLESANYWVDEASAVWSEELFSDTPSTYISTVYAPNILEPTKGMQAGAPGNAAAHGYGMAPLIKYLVARKGNGYPLALYTSLSGGASAVDAVIANSPTPGDQIWVQDFLTEMLKGDCYKLSMGDLGVLAPASQRLDVKTAADVKASKAFTVKSPDLSGLVYMTVLNSAPLPANATLSHRLTVDNPQDFTLTVLKAKTGAATEVVATSDPVADGAIKLDIPNLASMQADGWRLLTLVTNKRRLSPYLGQTPMTLTMGVTSVPCSIPLTPYVAQPDNINDVPFPEINVSGAIVAGGLSDMTQWPGDGVGILVANALGEPPIDVQVNLSCDFKTATKDVPTGFGGYYDRYTISGPFKKFRLELMDVDPFNPVQTLESSGPSFHLVLDKDKKGFQFNVYAYYDVTVQTYSGDGIPSGSPLVFHDIYACVFIGDFIP